LLRSIWFLFIFLTFVGLGIRAPFILTLGYVWVDIFSPQAVSYIILNQLPVAMIMGALAVGAYLLLDRRAPPRLTIITVLQLSLAVWVTLTTTWAEAPTPAWDKWNWAFKTLIFTAFIPLTIRTRVQIEAFLQVFMFSLGANLIPFGMKMAISGGGYGQALGLGGGNTGLGEGSTLAAVSVMTIPIYLFLGRHSLLIPKTFLIRLIYPALCVLAGLTVIGTFERTGLIGLLTLGGTALLRSRRKGLVLVVGAASLVAGTYVTTSAWNSRIETIGDYQNEGSALGRILVWRWTLDYVSSHPFGGGFMTFLIDHIEFPDGSDRNGVAFHSIYFEILGEHGWIGLALYLGMVIASLVALQKTIRQTRRHPELLWCRDMASALQIALVVLMVCGAFIGIAFQPMIHYLIAMAVSVSQCARRTVASLPVPAARGPVGDFSPSWRTRAKPMVVGLEPASLQHDPRHPYSRPDD
jgi:putative inorganic carbon (HCO3(-)) transporter